MQFLPGSSLVPPGRYWGDWWGGWWIGNFQFEFFLRRKLFGSTEELEWNGRNQI